jgi:hypothetical protein
LVQVFEVMSVVNAVVVVALRGFVASNMLFVYDAVS